MERTPMPLPINLLSDDIFVFGSDDRGHHDAGTAGLALRGDWKPNSHQDEAFLHLAEVGTGKGEWTVYGHTQGPSAGLTGKSYAVQTTNGHARSFPLDNGSAWTDEKFGTPLGDIASQLRRLCTFAAARPQMTFLIPELATGASGYAQTEMDELWASLERPDNLKFITLMRE